MFTGWWIMNVVAFGEWLEYKSHRDSSMRISPQRIGSWLGFGEWISEYAMYESFLKFYSIKTKICQKSKGSWLCQKDRCGPR